MKSEADLPANRLASLFLVLCAIVRPSPAAESFIGSVKTTRGGTALLRGTVRTPISEGMHIQLNDVLQTAADGVLGVILQDGTRISLGPNSELKLDRYLYEPADAKLGLLLRLSRGALAYISGKIAKFAPEAVSIETPVGVLGLRGTHLVVSIEGANP